MKLETGLKLGTCANLIDGYQASWKPGDWKASPLSAPKEKPLKEFDIEIVPRTAGWGDPEISLHRTAQELLNAVFPFTIVPPTDTTTAPVIPAGRLLMGDNDAEALKSLTATLGVDLA